MDQVWSGILAPLASWCTISIHSSHLSIYLSIYLSHASIMLSIACYFFHAVQLQYVSTHWSFHLSIHLSIHPSIHPIYLSHPSITSITFIDACIHLSPSMQSIYAYTHPSHLSIHLSIHYLYLSITSIHPSHLSHSSIHHIHLSTHLLQAWILAASLKLSRHLPSLFWLPPQPSYQYGAAVSE